ncbi:hypothetical protein BOTBODRAFT_32704 [Botryobasidium botryosum FD-172 SS1]|uniref:Fe2OG dioxygenase domain-containing protein n=1 Tax=Botryobasidium botryosum (strain FD-172 SS1) TaxID=930990 RepID=A0A067MSL0_BOTB1|nr:hypothetical protein BOTBODRAFT_32704 [Botryobasidium botryosum FD-172 SS1]
MPPTSSADYKKRLKHHLKSNPTPNTDAAHHPAFRKSEKYYKSKFPPPDLGAVLDLALLEQHHDLRDSIWVGKSDAAETRAIRTNRLDLGSLPSEDANKRAAAYAVPRVPGLVLLPSFLSSAQQRQLIKSCLRDQPRFPNETNLDTHYFVPEDGLWPSWERKWHAQTRGPDGPSGVDFEDPIIHPKASTSEQKPSGGRSLTENSPTTPSNFHEVASQPKPPPPPSSSLSATPATQLLPKLRWANIGRSYHWGTKNYDFSRKLAPFPEDIKDICTRVVRYISWDDVWGSSSTRNEEDWGGEGPETWRDSYEPDAGIVNFYQLKDTLMGHVDRSEVSATSPLVSISLGNAAIFLIGGLTRDVEPVPILLRSGDVVVMSGPGCRRAYHGVPRILEDTLPKHLAASSEDGDYDWGPFGEYMRTARINVNARQVFPRGFKPDIGL